MHSFSIVVGARTSLLSRAQVEEIHRELLSHHPNVHFDLILLPTAGDLDRSTSLRTLEKTDFFTKEIDHLLLTHQCQVAIHSAKDLPNPLPQGLQLIALTKGVDPADVLVLRPYESLHSLKPGAIVATSSEHREAAVKQLRQDFSFVDLRGTIPERLSKLDSGEADGVIVAEAALIRLNLTHLNRVRLPGTTVPFQGQLVVVAREGDLPMINLFRCMDVRQK